MESQQKDDEITDKNLNTDDFLHHLCCSMAKVILLRNHYILPAIGFDIFHDILLMVEISR